ncbi:TetR/AcrR family transcriptional regulator [Bordetella genomosp. 13]|uniref:TetR/AcrR family transcriptional regulator n=1 Tax=Bordetella genomosp. 13 TaxID=463040 RepID=UPI0011A0252C|nr:TetR/AcrR family transcriptional regulator [Bordetella genomosp. 13]
MPEPTSSVSPRRRLSRADRQRQLLEAAWQLAGEGTDALTLGRLAVAAGVAKPLVYDHFGTREGLLAAMYEDYDVRHSAIMDDAIATARATLKDKARVIAASYVACVLTQGREISDVLAALNGSPELAAVKKRYQEVFIEKCRRILAPYAGPAGIALPGMWAMLGAADMLSEAAACGDITEAQACDELYETIVGLVRRSK